MKVEIIVLICCLAVSYAEESRKTQLEVDAVHGLESTDSIKPLTRKARLIGGIGGIGGVGIVGGIGIVGGGTKGLGFGGSPGAKLFPIK